MKIRVLEIKGRGRKSKGRRTRETFERRGAHPPPLVLLLLVVSPTEN